uniref:F-box domain-containing protein n=1 Tax=Tetradesmus obliquus TaxID=3088 RepID=A0A383W1U9_TETOB|eukprot:jgi/Sobl393_1/5187/SZX71072.1
MEEHARRARTADIPQLHEQVVSSVLQHVALRHRLASSSLTCKSWRSAANAATKEVSLKWSYRHSDDNNRSRAASLEQWLHSHGAAVTLLKLDGFYGNKLLLNLPCGKLHGLRALSAKYCSLQLRANSAGNRQHEEQQPAITVQPDQPHCFGSERRQQQPGWAASSDAAAEPAAEQHNINRAPAAAAAAAAAAGSRATASRGPASRAAASQAAAAAAAAAASRAAASTARAAAECARRLVACRQLTQLQLTPDMLPEDAAGPFSGLQQLWELDLAGESCSVRLAGTLTDLPPDLTKLRLSWGGSEQLLSCTSALALAALTALQELEIQAFEAHGVRPDFLQSMGQLRFLKIEAGASPDALLLLCDALPLLGELRGVTFRVTGGEADALPASDAVRYAALLPASPHLIEADIYWDYNVAPLLAAGCARQMFPAGQQQRKSW